MQNCSCGEVSAAAFVSDLLVAFKTHTSLSLTMPTEASTLVTRRLEDSFTSFGDVRTKHNTGKHGLYGESQHEVHVQPNTVSR
jgi:hypothetical protein